VPVTIYLDEISNTARIPAIEDNIATLRDNGIAFVLGLQDDSGLQQRYGEEAARKIVANLNTKIVLGRNLHIAQAIETARLAGETTILTHSASSGDRGSSENQHPARRGLVTSDQIRRREQYEALVFLQEGVITKTRLFPFPPRDPATGEWILLYGSRREQALYHALRQKLETLAFDGRLARPHLTLRRSATTNGADGTFPVWPIYRLRHRDLSLDGTLGPLTPSNIPSLPRVPPEPAGKSVAMPEPCPADEGPKAAPLAEQAQAAVDVQDKDLPSSSDSEASPSPAPPPTETDKASPSGRGEAASPVAPPSVQGSDANALSEMTGFFRSIARRKITVPECERNSAPAGWQITLPEGPFVLVRHAFTLAYGERRRTNPHDILDRWRTAGLIAASHVDVTVEKPPIRVLAFTPLAVSRFIPAIRDEISTWPRLGRSQIHGLHSPAAEPAPVGTPLPAQGRSVTPEPSFRTTAPLRNNPDDALAAVIAWIQANRVALCAPERSEFGQWEAKSRGVPVLLVRTTHVMRTLFSRRFDARAVLTAWRDQGTIVALPNRFTVYMRAGDGEQANRRSGKTFMAFSWEALERAGLQRKGPTSQQCSGEIL
jgi:hypothetical protein